jgi:hypothetical protein
MTQERDLFKPELALAKLSRTFGALEVYVESSEDVLYALLHSGSRPRCHL